MKVLRIGATRTLGSAVTRVLRGRGHQLVTVGRTSGDVRADLTDPAQTARVYAEVGDVDAVVSAAVEAFVRAAALEIAPQRITAVRPTVFTQSLPAYGSSPGIPAVDVDVAAQAYVRSVEGPETGRVYRLQ